MKLTWKPDGKTVLVALDEKGAPRIHIGKQEPAVGYGYVATILERGMPSGGPYMNIPEAQAWAERAFRKHCSVAAIFLK